MHTYAEDLVMNYNKRLHSLCSSVIWRAIDALYLLLNNSFGLFTDLPRFSNASSIIAKFFAVIYNHACHAWKYSPLCIIVPIVILIPTSFHTHIRLFFYFWILCEHTYLLLDLKPSLKKAVMKKVIGNEILHTLKDRCVSKIIDIVMF